VRENNKVSKTKRQKLRKLLIIGSFLLMPITFYYFSPAVILNGASEGIITGSFIIFGLLFLSSLLLGRAFCGWVCPAGGCQEACFGLRGNRARGGRFNWIKYFIWVPWLGTLIAMFIKAGGVAKADPFYLTWYGISVSDMTSLIMLVMVVLIIAGVALASGKRGLCHYACWMAPFMIIGRKIRNAARWSSLQLVAELEKCTDCKKCRKVCPMSLDVNNMVAEGSMQNTECILCGMCVDNCPNHAITYSFGPPPQVRLSHEVMPAEEKEGTESRSFIG
jgi:ferredoxin-type protein NapH